MFIGIGSLIVASIAMRSLAEVTNRRNGIGGVDGLWFFPPLLFKWLTTHKGENRPFLLHFGISLKLLFLLRCF
jgi:hypothetical protein